MQFLLGLTGMTTYRGKYRHQHFIRPIKVGKNHDFSRKNLIVILNRFIQFVQYSRQHLYEIIM